jgi:hypothetical protein
MYFYSLLHLENSQKSAMNVHVRNFDEQIFLYLRNALTLNNSLKEKGLKFKLITNNFDLLSKYIKPNMLNIEILEVKMASYIPKGLPFYSAHYKLEAFRYIAENTTEYAIFCDLDMIAVNEVPFVLLNCVRKGLPLYYDITSQVIPAYSSEKIISDLSLLINQPSEGRWAGGELIAGQPQFFSKLVKVIEEILPQYLENVKLLHHIGDEAYTSAALEILRSRGEYISDAGTLGIVQRYWCGLTKHKQANFEFYRGVFLLHLPSSKNLLSWTSSNEKIIRNFHFIYKLYLIFKSLNKTIRSFYFGIKNILK